MMIRVVLTVLFIAGSLFGAIDWSSEETHFLEGKKEIRIGAMDEWPPFDFVDYRHRPKGIGADLVRLLNKRLDGKLSIISGSWNSLYEQTKSGQLDALLDITPKQEREKFFNFTEPYLRIPHVFVAKKNTPYIQGFEALKGKSIALEKGFGVIRFIRENYPGIRIEEYRDTSHALDAVKKGEAFAYVGNRAVAEYIIKQELLNTLMIHGRDSTRKGSVLAIGTPKDKALLRDILQKALDDISPKEFNTILSNWSNERKIDIGLSPAEKLYLRQKKQLHFATASEPWAPFVFADKTGKKTGLEMDYANLLESRLNVPVKITYLPWNQVVEKAMQHEFDAIFPASPTPERKRFLNFSHSYYLAPLALYTKADAKEGGDWKSFSGKKIAVIKGSSFREIIREKRPDLGIIDTADTRESLQLVDSGKVDGVFDLLPVLKYHAQELSLQKRLRPYLFVYDEAHGGSKYGIRNDEPHLRSIINKAIASYQPDEKQEIKARWEGVAKVNPKNEPSGIRLSNAEKAFLKKHPTIVLGADQNWQPFDFRDRHGRHAGFDADYLALLREKLQIDIQVKLGKWGELQEQVRKREIDGLVGPSVTAGRSQYMAFTEPYFLLTQVVLLRKEVPRLKRLEDLNGKTLAIKQGNANVEYFRTNYPNIKQKHYETYGELLMAVSLGEVDAGICNIGAASYEMEKRFISNIKVGHEVHELAGDMRFGIRKDWPELASILQKGIDAISHDEINVILERWLKLASQMEVEDQLDLTRMERLYIARHPKVKVGYSSQIEPMLIKEGTHLSGILPEYFELLSSKTGLAFEIIDASWKKTLQQASQKKYDGVGLITEKAAHSLGLLKSKEPFDFLIAAFARSGSALEINSEKDLAGMRVAYFKNARFLENYFKKRKDITTIPTDSPFEAIKKVLEGKADLMVGSTFSSYLLSKHSIINIEPIYVFDDALSPHSGIGIQSDRPQLLSILNKAIDSITLEERNAILKKWSWVAESKKSEVKLTSRERAFLQKHPLIRVHNESNWPPFNFFEFGQPQGYSIDLMNLIAKKTGMNIKYVSGPTWEQFLRMAQEKDLDVMLNIVRTPERQAYLNFTDPFINAQHAIFVREDDESMKDFDDLLNGKTVALVKGFYYHEYIQEHYPEMKLLLVDSEPETLQAVAYGRADATMGIMPTLRYSMQKNYITNLRSFGDPEAEIFDEIPLSLAARKDAPELVSILQKGLASLSARERRELSDNWLGGQIEEKVDLGLSDEERKWLKAHPFILFTADPKYLPYEGFTPDGKYTGMVAEYLQLVEKRLGISFKKIPTQSWTESLELARSGKVDVLSNYTVDKSLEDVHISTRPYIQSPISIIMQKDEKQQTLTDLGQLNGKNVAVIKGYGYLEEIFDAYPDLHYIEVENAEEGMEGVSAGRYDAMICSLTLATYMIGEMGLSNLEVVGQTGTEMELGLGVRRDWEIFVRIFNKAIASITPGERREIRQHWLGNAEIAMGIQPVTLDFTEQEQAWLDKNIPIRYVYDPDWAPFEWTNDLGKHTGIIYDLIMLVAERTGITFERVGTDTWSEAVTLAENKQVDMYSGLGENEERRQYMHFTDNVLYRTPYVFVVHKDNQKDYFETFKAIRDEKVAVVNGYTIHGIMKEKQPGIRLTPLVSTMEGFQSVTDKKVDVFIVNAATAKYYMNRKGFDKLKIATKTEYNLEIKPAIRDDWPPEVISILDKAIASISEKELADIYTKWTELVVEETVDYTILLQIAGGVGLIFLAIIYWNRQLNRTVQTKTAELKLLLEDFDQHVIASKTDLDGNITYVSDAFCKISGFRREELMGCNHRKVKHPDNEPSVYEELWRTISREKKIWVGEIKNRKKDGTYYWVDAIIQPDFDLDGKHIGYSAIRQDITAQKAFEGLSATLEQKIEERTQELSENQEFLASVLDSQTSIVLTTDGKMIRSANRSFLDFFGIDFLEEFTDEYDCICDRFNPNEEKGYLLKHMGEKSWIEYILANPDAIHKACINSTIFTVHAAEMDTGKEHFFIAVLNDITSLESVQEELEKQGNLLQNILDSSPVGIAFTSDGIFEYANPEFKKQFGLNAGDSFLAICPDEEECRNLTERIHTEGEVLHSEQRLIGEDQTLHDFLTSYIPMVHAGKEGFMGFLLDITERKRAEVQLQNFHKKISDSINYASLIQNALLPEMHQMQAFFNDHFAIWQPKDVVGGDVYLFEQLRHEDEALLMVVDCTGHGVPGAFMTMLVKAVERNIIGELLKSERDVHPGEILQVFNRSIRTLLRQESRDSTSNAGFDGGVLYIDKSRNLIRFAGAETPLFYFRKEEPLQIIKGDRHGIGYRTSDPDYVFSEHELLISEVESFLMTTDGYIDQNGGEKGFPFGKKRLKSILEEKRLDAGSELQKHLMEALGAWQKETERNDDVTLLWGRV